MNTGVGRLTRMLRSWPPTARPFASNTTPWSMLGYARSDPMMSASASRACVPTPPAAPSAVSASSAEEASSPTPSAVVARSVTMRSRNEL